MSSEVKKLLAEAKKAGKNGRRTPEQERCRLKKIEDAAHKKRVALEKKTKEEAKRAHQKVDAEAKAAHQKIRASTGCSHGKTTAKKAKVASHAEAAPKKVSKKKASKKASKKSGKKKGAKKASKKSGKKSSKKG